MLEKFVDKYIKYQTERGLLLDEEAGIYRYGYMLLLETIINIVISLIIGLVMKDVLSVLIFLLAFVPLRSYAGGYHADKVWKCILLSNFCVFIVLLLSRVIDSLNCGNVLMSIDVIVSIIIFLLAPVDSDKKVLSNNERKVYRMIVLFILVIQFVFCLLLRDRAEIVTLSNIIVLISMIKVPDRDTSR